MEAIAIAAGWYHTCAASPKGQVFCWGQNTNGQLGNGSREDSLSSVHVTDLQDVTAVSAGAAHSCALTAAGEVYYWGQNEHGQLGDGTRTDRPEPVAVTGLDGSAVSIAAGSIFTCALLTDGPVECWGEFGFVPVPENARIRTSAVAIPNLERDVQEIATGNYHLCVLTKSNEVKCEGMIVPPNDPPFVESSEILRELQGNVRHILAGTDFNCVLTYAGSVNCWGDNYFGQLGDGTFIPSAEPRHVNVDNKEVVALGGGYYTACALTSDGGVTCWGDTSFGQLGDGNVRWK